MKTGSVENKSEAGMAREEERSTVDIITLIFKHFRDKEERGK